MDGKRCLGRGNAGDSAAGSETQRCQQHQNQGADGEDAMYYDGGPWDVLLGEIYGPRIDPARLNRACIEPRRLPRLPRRLRRPWRLGRPSPTA